jgi:hypothetical protein
MSDHTTGPEQPVIPGALAKATASNPNEAKTQIGLGCAGTLVILGLMVWGFASCTSNVGKSWKEHSQRYDEEKAAERARAATPEGPSNTLLISSAQQAVKRQLLDDRAAHFRDVNVVIQANGSKAVCGEVNSKNRAGGYAGYQHFISAGTDKHTWLEEQVPEFATAWNQLCVK